MDLGQGPLVVADDADGADGQGEIARLDGGLAHADELLPLG
ncbi:MAG TPA: hypothetical protein VKE22_12265 [Haliangiales bacterium]|nr:hypothetical protein [Haliangiales bacterium]